MKVLVARISQGRVFKEKKELASIGKGLALFVGIEKKDTLASLTKMASKVVNLRVFEDEQGKLNYSLKDKNYQLLCISNFTLCADTERGRRPSFEESMPREQASKYFEDFVSLLKKENVDVKQGAFGEFMRIELVLEGPVNIILTI
ncbi:MAG: D-tyrosyl-tRNA(Tyr) deacylase [Candidatus Omnitrophota bacterium]|nr:D-tyrosyl-tRNA(Tyr) deacylase [Candidatus Omnitrophota bacterium]RKY34064.1 MAG: D-tyrosyl-tRNA(Tyr) deacylase [Candidatus Omnitrophota bacterium]RKY46148.1 MAG: D-tyrosyl-tRNA(Tyr) deacylase [Candidatus Omnitrophota bacterium]